MNASCGRAGEEFGYRTVKLEEVGYGETVCGSILIFDDHSSSALDKQTRSGDDRSIARSHRNAFDPGELGKLGIVVAHLVSFLTVKYTKFWGLSQVRLLSNYRLGTIMSHFGMPLSALLMLRR